MAKILCVLYDDPVDGYPQTYARVNIPKLERYPKMKRGAYLVNAPRGKIGDRDAIYLRESKL